MKNNLRGLVICACCVCGGVALGVVADRKLAGGGGRANMARADAANAKGARDARAGAGSNGAAARDDGAEEFPELAGLKTVAQWQEYIERWLATGSPEKNRGNVDECLRRWSEADAEGVLAFVHGAKQFPWRYDAYALSLAVIGRTDVQRVIGWLRQNLPEKERGDVAEKTIMVLKDKHPQEAWGLALAELELGNNVSWNSRYFGAIIQSMLKTNPADALRALDSMPDGEKAYVAGYFAEAWVEKDSQAALAWCAAQKGKPFAEDAAMALLGYLAKEKPSEFYAAAERLGVPFDAPRYGYFLHVLTEKDPLVALEVLQKMPKEQMQDYGSSVVRALFQTDADQAVAAAQVLLPESERALEICQNYQEWTYSDRKAAEDWLEKEADAETRGQIKMRLLAENDPTAFLASIGSTTDLNGAFIASCLDNALRRAESGETLRWLLANPNQMTNWRLSGLFYGYDERVIPEMITNLANAPEGKALDKLIGFVAEQPMDKRHWDAAENLLPLASDSAVQDKLRYKIFSSMMSNPSEQEAAREWLATQPLSDEVRASWETLATPASASDGASANNDGDEVVEMIPYYVE